jgi:hypothetical protein
MLGSVLVKMLGAFYGAREFITMLAFILSHMNPVTAIAICFFWIYFNFVMASIQSAFQDLLKTL